ncbi:MAG: FMN-binding glutamate synthase family protein [Gammaproteobacteria bacterium]|nr:FMN-binding glutamate synthase family protein [Gammaproteobacteria bacterium]
MTTWWILGAVALLVLLIALHDLLQKRHAVLRIYPVIGHFRYLIEAIGPELRQYIVADDKEETPFNRSERSWVYATSKGQNNYFGFGTTELQYTTGYPIIKNRGLALGEHQAEYANGEKDVVPCLKVMGAAHGRRRPWRPRSVVNISGMSFGALGRNATRALNKGARLAGCYHNTGEGGFSAHHQMGAEVIWQLGTGYFGARDEDGNFSLDRLADTVAANDCIRAIEIKLSQGAKPGKGGVLPGAKVVAEIAAARGVPEGTDCISPNTHREFSDPAGMLEFIEKIAARTGLPVGVKAAIGETIFWDEVARLMRETGKGPDYIQIDGGEGGTGAAPLTYADHVSLPFKLGFQRVYRIFLEAGIVDRVVWIGSGKLGFPDRAATAMAMGCDLIAVGREAMMSVGCIQSRSCHTGHCPTGVATMDPWRQRGLDVDGKALRAATYIRGFRRELLSLAHTAGYQHPGQFTGADIELSTGVNQFTPLDEVLGYCKQPVAFDGMAGLLPGKDS